MGRELLAEPLVTGFWLFAPADVSVLLALHCETQCVRRAWRASGSRLIRFPVFHTFTFSCGANVRLRRSTPTHGRFCNRTFQLSSPQRWDIDAVRRGRATASMGHRCCPGDIHGPLLRLPGPAEQHRCPIVAVAAQDWRPGAWCARSGRPQQRAAFDDAHKLVLTLRRPPASATAGIPRSNVTRYLSSGRKFDGPVRLRLLASTA